MNNIVLFDGDCLLCVYSVQFIIRRDHQALYRFASVQSDIGKEILRKYDVPNHIDSLILIEGNKCYFKSSAALRICKNLSFGWKLLYCFIVVPKTIRDVLYDFIAKNRYKWFGKKDSCIMPSPEIKKRFLT